MAPVLPRDGVEYSGCSGIALVSSTSNRLQVDEERCSKRRNPDRERMKDGTHLVRRQDTTEPLYATTDRVVPTAAASPDSLTPTERSSVSPSAIPPTTVHPTGDTSASLTTPMLSSTSIKLLDDSHVSQRSLTHALLGWQIALIAATAVVVSLILPWFILRRFRRIRFYPRNENVDLPAYPHSLLDSERQKRRDSEQYSHENSLRWGPVQPLVDFLSFGSVQDSNYRTRSYISGSTSLSDPPPAYYLHPTNRRASAAPTYRTRPESLQPVDHRRTWVLATRLPVLRLELPEGDEGWAAEFDRELRTPYTPGRVDPETPAGIYISSPSTGSRAEKR